MNSRNMNHSTETDQALGDLISFLDIIAEKYELNKIEMLGILEYSKRQISSVEEEWVMKN